MVPRADIFMLPLEMDFEDLIKAIKQGNFSRVPIYGQNPEDIVGILHAKDLLSLSVDEVRAKRYQEAPASALLRAGK